MENNNEHTTSKEVKVSNMLSRANISLSRTELREAVRDFNNFEMPIGRRLDDIMESPGSFIQYLKNKQSFS